MIPAWLIEIAKGAAELAKQRFKKRPKPGPDVPRFPEEETDPLDPPFSHGGRR